MDGYAYPFGPPYPMRGEVMEYPDRGDGLGDFYLNRLDRGRSRSVHRNEKRYDTRRTRSLSSKSRSHSRSKSRSRSKLDSGTHSVRSKSRSRSRSRSASRQMSYREPSFLDAFRVLYLTPSKHKKNTNKYLATKKREDKVKEILKQDGLGSKKWFFYPRSQQTIESVKEENTSSTCDQRIKVDGEFFRKYKKFKKIDSNAPVAKLKRWELLFYKKLGFIQAI